MAFQARQQNQFTMQIIGQSVNNQAAAERLNNPVPMGRVNPFATTVENPWLGMNHMLLGSNNMVLQQPTNGIVLSQGGMTNSVPADNHLNASVPVPSYAPRNIQEEMNALLETDRMLFQQSKRIKMQYAVKHREAVTQLVETVRTPILEKLQEKEDKIANMEQLIDALDEKVKTLKDEIKFWKDIAKVREATAEAFHKSLETVLTELRGQQGAVPPNDAVAVPPDEQNVESYCGSGVSEKNAQGKAQGSLIVNGTAAEKVQTGAAETGEIWKVQTGAAEKGESSGEKMMCKSCGEMESRFLALPCMHLCFCTLCGTREDRLKGPCPVCDSTMTATVAISLI